MGSDYTFSNQVIPNPYQITQQNLNYIFNLTDKTLQIDCLENTIDSKGIFVRYRRVTLHTIK